MQDDEASGSFDGVLIENLVDAVSQQMRQTLALAPGGEFTPESIEFVQQAAQRVIEGQCELLRTSTQQLHKDIVAQVVLSVNRW